MLRNALFLGLCVILSACGNCRQGNCFIEVPLNFGGQFLTEERVSRDIRSAWGITDQFVGTRNQYQIDSNHFEASVQGIEGFEAVQKRTDWCWAAAISMVMNYRGVPLEQCDVLRSLGRDCNSNEPQFGSVSSMITALRGWQVNDFGRPAAVEATSLATGNGTALIEDVATDWPPIVGLDARRDQPGHVYVLTDIEYSWMPGTWNVPVIWRVKLFDPWNGSYVTMRGSEFDRLFDFAIRVRVLHG